MTRSPLLRNCLPGSLTASSGDNPENALQVRAKVQSPAVRALQSPRDRSGEKVDANDLLQRGELRLVIEHHLAKFDLTTTS